MLGEYEQGLLSFEKSYELFARSGALWGTAFALSKMGLASDGLGEHAQALRYHQEALSTFERVGNNVGKAYSLSRMSMSACFLGEYPQAIRFGQEGQRIFEETGHRWGVCASLCRLGFATIGLGDVERAKGHFETALRQSQEHQILPLSLYALAGLACTLAQEGEKGRALELFRYVRRHPQTPAPYLEQALRWIGDQDQASPEEGSPAAGAGGEMEAIDEVAARLLR